MNKASIGIVESSSRIYHRLGISLLNMGHEIHRLSAGNLVAEIAEHPCELLLASDPLPGLSVFQLLDRFEGEGLMPQVILVSEKISMQQVVSAIRNGARDYLLLSDDTEPALRSITAALEEMPKKRSHERRPNHPAIVGRSPAVQSLLDMAKRVAPSSATVLIQGESGTGKELIARYLHVHSDRANRRFVAMNCAALPENLAESELFGHEKGAFTGAVQRKRGKFEQAHDGTLLLDEISEMPLSLQAKLLRVLQEKEVDPIGSQRAIPVDVRIIATTNRDIGQMVAEGLFRKDLFYRLRIVPLHVPSLRERRQDIAVLIDHFVKKYSEPGSPVLPRFTAAAVERMHQWNWPGNVRELENTIERALLICQDPLIGPECLLLEEPLPGSILSSSAPLVGLTVKELEERLIVQTLRHVNQNRTHAAEMLGISIRTLRNKLREYRQEDDVRVSAAGAR